MNNKMELQSLITSAAHIIEGGGVVILPTDTVYGIYGSALNDKAIDRAYKIKGRKRNKPLGIASTAEKVNSVVELNDTAIDLIDKCWPGPISIIANKKPGVIPPFFSGEVPGLLVVCAENEVLSGVINECRVPIFSTTCNLAGEDEARTIEELAPFRPMVDLVIENRTFEFRGTPSTIVDTTGETPIIIREGAYPVDILTSKVDRVSVNTKMLIQ